MTEKSDELAIEGEKKKKIKIISEKESKLPSTYKIE